MIDTPVVVPQSPLQMQLTGQLRLAIAAVGGSLVLHKLLPADLVNDQTIDIVVGALMLGGAAAWSWVKAKLVHGELKSIANNPSVPDRVAYVVKT